MRTASTASRTNAGVLAAIGTAVAGAVLALVTGLGQGLTASAETVSTSTVVTTPGRTATG